MSRSVKAMEDVKILNCSVEEPFGIEGVERQQGDINELGRPYSAHRFGGGDGRSITGGTAGKCMAAERESDRVVVPLGAARQHNSL